MSEQGKPEQFRIADQSRTERARTLVDGLIAAVVPVDKRPYIVTDEATIFDLTTCSESEIIDRLAREYGTRPSHEELAYPLWRLAELLGSRSRPN
jgi:hypothetical protein